MCKNENHRNYIGINPLVIINDFVFGINVTVVKNSKDVLPRSIYSFSKQKVSKAVHVIVQCEFIFTTLENSKQMFKFSTPKTRFSECGCQTPFVH